MTSTTLDDLVVSPESAVSAAALEMATAYFSSTMLNHSLRVYVWAAAHGTSQNIHFDPELLFVASLFHDIGLVPEFDSHAVSFEEAGGQVARVFAAGAGWPAERRERLPELISRHVLGDRVDLSMDPEGHLLARAAGVEITGRHADDFSPGFKAEVLQRYPRLSFIEEFLALSHEQAQRKPDSPPATWIRTNLDARMADNPLDETPLRLPAGD
ncbi:HD domain-containing protein [Actinopolymorpha sp. NPDC004070]|uniref:HD domain-containing protein n=1 Tax=Actinopolymorpha sp. NPDC004070 TaxID=3154548 RepID=UPI0033BD9CED